MTKPKILRVDGSMRQGGSRSRALTDALVKRLQSIHGAGAPAIRDLSEGVPFVDSPWIEANFTDPCERSSEQRAVLARSDALLNELKSADILVIGSPVYNFGVPAALKAWVDMVVRAKESFRYTKEGPEGLLKDKTAYVVLVSGGTKAGSEIDFAWPYLRHILGFIGITDVEMIYADGIMGEDGETKIKAAFELVEAA